MNRREQFLAYQRLMGLEAAKRQADLAECLYTCCGYTRPGPHHPLCRGETRAA